MYISIFKWRGKSETIFGLEHSQQWCYIGILVYFSFTTPKNYTAAVKVKAKILDVQLQCTSIYKYAL